MNIQSIILLAIVLAAVVFVGRYLYLTRGRKSCCKDCNGCRGCGTD